MGGGISCSDEENGRTPEVSLLVWVFLPALLAPSQDWRGLEMLKCRSDSGDLIII